jgi:hypothetical protein
MSGPTRRFDPGELAGDGTTPPSDVEAAGLLGMARELEDLARSEPAAMSAGFEDRVMAAVRLAPSPARAAAAAAGLGGLFGRIGLAWRDLWGGGRPAMVRAQAFALLLTVAVAATSVGAVASVGVARLLDPGLTPPPTIPETSPSGSPVPILSPSPSMTPSAVPTPTPTPSTRPTPSSTPDGTSEPTKTPGSTDDGGAATASPRPTGTARPTGTPKATATPHATNTPDPTDTSDPEETEDPTATPDSGGDGTPEPTDVSGSGSDDRGGVPPS